MARSALEAAELLVPTAQVVAVTSYTTIARVEELVYSVPTALWDSVGTSAGVCFALCSLDKEELGEETANRVLRIVFESLNQTDPKLLGAVADCKSFVERTLSRLAEALDRQSSEDVMDSFGFWMVWNLVGHAPDSVAERRLARLFGGLVTHSFLGWWSDSDDSGRRPSAADRPETTLAFRFGRWVRRRLIERG